MIYLCFLVIIGALLFFILISNQISLQITDRKYYNHKLSKECGKFKLNKLTEDQNFQIKKKTLYNGEHEMQPTIKSFV